MEKIHNSFRCNPEANLPEDMDQYLADFDDDTDVRDDSKDKDGNFILVDCLTKRDKNIAELNETINELETTIPKIKQEHNSLERQALKNK